MNNMLLHCVISKKYLEPKYELYIRDENNNTVIVKVGRLDGRIETLFQKWGGTIEEAKKCLLKAIFTVDLRR